MERIRRGRAGRWARRTVCAVLAALVWTSAVAAGSLRLADVGDPSAAGRTRGTDGLWMGHAWVDGRRSAADTTALAARLRSTGIRELYVHTGPLADDGSLDPALYPDAAALVRRLHRLVPGVSVQAWLGDKVAHGPHHGLRPDDPAVRARVAASARQVLDTGFDGVHLDLEPVPTGDRGYLRLLDGVRAVTRARGRTLSAATPQIDPVPGLHLVGAALADRPKWWTRGYFGAVARRVDQVAVMAYDTGTPTSGTFGGYVAWQTSMALRETPPGTLLLIGLPGYTTDDIAHHSWAETVGAAVRGARLGLARTAPGRRRFGLSLYVDFTATAADWAAYRTGWGARRTAVRKAAPGLRG